MYTLYHMVEGGIFKRALREYLAKQKQRRARNKTERISRKQQQEQAPLEPDVSSPAEPEPVKKIEGSVCSRCNGSGKIFSRQNKKLKNQRMSCPICRGTGKTT
jgi:formylmethanofuran dehydrogenase subunit E